MRLKTEADEQASSKYRIFESIRLLIEVDGYHPGSTMVEWSEDAARRIGITQPEIDHVKQQAKAGL